jgi:hypothetical protein
MDVRQELHAYLDILPEAKLKVLKPLLSFLAHDMPDDEIIIETDLTDEEREIIAQEMEEYAIDPGSFVPLERIG